jgi:uncharacterized Zn finger protein
VSRGWKRYVPVAARRERARKASAKASKAGEALEGVFLDSRTIAHTFWGKAWCTNLETYSDYENRLPRGRTYVRNGSVIDLKIGPGQVQAQVFGSSRYQIKILIAPMEAKRWQALVRECTGSIASLVELLQGKFSHAVMEHICAARTGLFPSPQEIKFACSCPDWAAMCKHVAAALYGVGARLDDKPELLFVLRQVEATDLLTSQAVELPSQGMEPTRALHLEEAQLADVFGIELAMPPPGKDAAPSQAGEASPVATRRGAAHRGAAHRGAAHRGKSTTAKKPGAEKKSRPKAGPKELPVGADEDSGARKSVRKKKQS